VDLQYATQHILDFEYLPNIQATCGICYSTYSGFRVFANIQATCGICYSIYSGFRVFAKYSGYRWIYTMLLNMLWITSNVKYSGYLWIYNMLLNTLWITSICKIFRLPVDLHFAFRHTVLWITSICEIFSTNVFTICYLTYSGLRVFAKYSS
jgi:hypothetical protein